MRRAVLFLDVDGTLVPQGTTGAHIAEALGHVDALAAAELAYERGEVSNAQVCVIDAAGWAGRRVDEVAGWLESLPLVRGISEVVDWCAAHDVVPVLTSLAWAPVTSVLATRLGVATTSGPTLEVRAGRFTGEVGCVLEADGKRDRALEFASACGVPPDRCALVGDGRSDLPLLEQVGLSVAFNASSEVREAATVAVSGDDLRLILPAVEAWLAATVRRADSRQQRGGRT